MNRLNNAGFKAYAVGGCVRNFLMGKAAKDFDVATNAMPESILNIFADCKTVTNGIKHGTVTVIVHGEPIETTAFRRDGKYLDCRRPMSVSFCSELSEDLKRRDFTVNAMAYSDDEGVIDYFGGLQDIKRGLIRCVGEPDERFGEDALRIMRALRFASVYGFSVEEKTALSIHKNKRLLNNISAERIYLEFVQTLCGKAAARVLDEFRDVFAVIIPQLEPCFDFFLYGKNHRQTLWEHMIRAVDKVGPKPELRLAMLLHDIAKTSGKASGKLKSCSVHAEMSADIAGAILTGLKASRKLIDKVMLLINYHDYPLNGGESSVKRLMGMVGKENALLILSQIRRADIAAQNEVGKEKRLEKLKEYEDMCRNFISTGVCVDISGLDINGDDLISSGFESGRNIGVILNSLLDAVIDGRVENKRESLLSYAENIKNKKED